MTAAPVSPAEPADRRRRRTARTRAGIEEAALRLFTEQGFDATTVEQIAEAADIAPRTFFRHFPSKDAVLFGDPLREQERLREVLLARPAGEHPMRKLAAAMFDTAHRIQADRQQHLMRAQLLDSLEATGDYESHLMHRRWVHDVAAALAEHCGDGSCPEPRLYTWAMLMMTCFGSAMREWLVCTDGTSLPVILAGLLDETTAGMRTVAEETGAAFTGAG
ncbi:TetR family transcriptional regulator [Saccharopolyspora sp. NFXS83]|uniref:TetR family transcriptional regulator n=1 Tax=Saccharopolyspora sp. NFXS83 TaxID=2993560 RepID=UPI00224A94A4|nr:TetR family transcriptional regulator [Saccharopolyspora sp. NFXS83]MCX2730241.1 TetR family transcriptional regulator [Saccharopolyspora sp. NFXS83]